MSKQTWKDKLKALGVKLSVIEIKMAAHPLADGGNVYTEAEAAAVGDAIYTNEEMTEPVADGSYTLANGQTVIVAGGQIAEIIEASSEGEEMEAAIEELGQQVIAANAATQAAQAEVTALKAQVAELTTKNTELSTKLRTIKPTSVTNANEETETEPTRPKVNAHLFKKVNVDLEQFKINEN